MPVTQPAEVASGRAVQIIRVDSPPTAPYVLKSCFVVPSGTIADGGYFGVRHLKEPTSGGWFQTQYELIARTATHDYYEIAANITSGTETRFAIDVVTGSVDISDVTLDSAGVSVTRNNRSIINADAWRVLNLGSSPFDAAVSFQLSGRAFGGGSTQLSDRAYLTGFGPLFPQTPNAPMRQKMWTGARQNVGNHRWGPVLRTLYKHIPMKLGGEAGYLHIWATVFANSPEVQFIVNWHNGVIEERQEPVGSTGAGGLEDPSSLELESPPGGFGAARMRDVIFAALELINLNLLPNFTSAITFTGATYTHATKRLVKVGAFTSYVHRAGNRVLINAGADATHGDYEIAARISNDEIELAISLGSAADSDTDVGGSIVPYWTITPELLDASVTPSVPADPAFALTPPIAGIGSGTQAVVGPISVTDPNRLHILPITSERSFRFALHPSTVVPYTKLVTGRSNWARGGWGFQPLGAPDLDAVNSTAVALDLTAKAATAKTRLRTLQPYSIDGDGSDAGMTTGMVPSGSLLPGSWQGYGGQTSGLGMLHNYGMKSAWDAKKGALDILKVEQLRVQSRHPGCMYYNVSGLPVNPWAHSRLGTDAPWMRRNRVFQKSGTTIYDSPFLIQTLRNPTARAQLILTADYNPGPSGALNPVSTPTDSTAPGEGNVPDWWAWGADANGDNVGDGIPGDALVANLTLTYDGDTLQNDRLRNTNPPATADLGPYRDEAAPVLIQCRSAETFTSADSIVFEITGTGQLGLAATEQITCTGAVASSGSAPANQAWQGSSEFRTVTSIKVVSVTGSPASTEKFTVGRASQKVPNYNGDDPITAIDWQHMIRQLAPNKALFLLENDPLAKLYLWMNAMDARMHYWSGPGRAFNLSAQEHGGTGRGSNSTREHAWLADTMATFAAIAAGHYQARENNNFANIVLFGTTGVSFGLSQWFGQMTAKFRNARMPNGLLLGYLNKNSTQSPLGNRNGIDGNKSAFYITAGREECYLVPTLHMLTNVWLPSSQSDLRNSLDLLKADLRASGAAFRNYLSDQQPSPSGNHLIYMPVAARKDATGAYVYCENIGDTVGTWEVFGPTQASIIEANPLTGLAVNPATYPTVSATRFAAAVTGTSAQLNAGAVGDGTVFTIANANVGQAYVSGPFSGTQIPTPVRLTVTGTSFTNAKKRTFRITGTGFIDATGTYGTITEDLFVQGRGATSQTYTTVKHFRTVTEIKMVATPGTDAGSTVVGETFSFGNAPVGLRSDAGSELLGGSEGLHLGIALAAQKYLLEEAGASSTDIDALIGLYCGSAATLADALTYLQARAEYSGGEKLERWSSLLWQIGQNTGSIAPAADFDKTTASGAAPLKVGFLGKGLGRIVLYEWDWDNDGTYEDSGQYAQHTFVATSTVKLRVTDSDGTQATSTQVVTVV